ncbi:MAG: hydrolase or metal-binding protein, partial [Acinetobacter sp.]
GFNSIRTLAARLSYYHAASNGLVSCLPLQLTLRGKSTTQSYRTPVYYVDLTLRDGVNLQQAIQMAKEIDQQSKASGFNQHALDQMALQCFSNARFEVNAEEGLDLVEEFYTDELVESEQTQPELKSKVKAKPNQGEGFVRDIQQGLQKSVHSVI